MVASNILPGPGLSKKINLVCLLAAVVIVLVLPFKKEIWYDETVSILCSKGISHDTPNTFASANTISSSTLEQMNNTKHVFSATVIDNSNSFLYNICLHFFTLLFGNSLMVYLLFSKLCAIAALLALFAFSNLLARDHLFTSVALLLLTFDLGFLSISHEIRTYSMTIFLLMVAAIFWYKFVFERGGPIQLFFMVAFLAAAFLAHFLSVYIAAVMVITVVWYRKAELISIKNLLAIIVPAVFLGIFFYYARSGFILMGLQSQHIQQQYASHFSWKAAVLRSMRFTALNFKAVYPAFRNYKSIILISFLLEPALYIIALKTTKDIFEKRMLHILFAFGWSSTVFLLLLSFKSHHYTSLYYRYYSFCLPFCSLFVAWALYVFVNSERVNIIVKYALPVVILGPVIALFILGVRKEVPELHYNHHLVAEEIIRKNADKLTVPDWKDAVLVQSFLPSGYKIDYFRGADTSGFVINYANSQEKLPVIRQEPGSSMKQP